MEVIRCKFVCVSHTEFQGYQKVLHNVKFVPVSSGSEENKTFYNATPGGSLEIATIERMPFEIGKEYYLDITPSEVHAQ